VGVIIMLFRLDNFLGINNVDEARRRIKSTFLPNQDVDLSGDLSKCVNFDITKDGIMTTRNGQTLKASFTQAHSLWSPVAGTLGLFVDNGQLKILNADWTASTVYTGLDQGRMVYEEHRNTDHTHSIFMGNGRQMLKYKDGVVTLWGSGILNFTDEFHSPPRNYNGPPLSDIILSYRDRMYAADGRYLLYSDEGLPENFRRANVYPAREEITALSCDNSHIYIHSRNMTKVMTGLVPGPTGDFIETEYPIGAIRHGALGAPFLKTPIIMTRYGWAMCVDGQVTYLDKENFRLDLGETAEAYMFYNPKKEYLYCRIKQ
jgi:hypothetical protein